MITYSFINIRTTSCAYSCIICIGHGSFRNYVIRVNNFNILYYFSVASLAKCLISDSPSKVGSTYFSKCCSVCTT